MAINPAADLIGLCARDPNSKFCQGFDGPLDIACKFGNERACAEIGGTPPGGFQEGGDPDLLETIAGAAIGGAVGGIAGPVGAALGGGVIGSALTDALTRALTTGDFNAFVNVVSGNLPSLIGGGLVPRIVDPIASLVKDVGGFGGGFFTPGVGLSQTAEVAGELLSRGNIDISSLLLGGGGGGVFSSLFRSRRLPWA